MLYMHPTFRIEVAMGGGSCTRGAVVGDGVVAAIVVVKAVVIAVVVIIGRLSELTGFHVWYVQWSV